MSYLTLKDFMESVKYRITEGAEYQWKCFGNHAYMLDSEYLEDGHYTYSSSVIFDRRTQVVYEMVTYDYKNDRSYRWIHPDYIKKIKKESKKRNVRFEQSCDDNDFIDLELPEDIVEKTKAIVDNKDYDIRVMMPLNLTDSEKLVLMEMAHEADLTLNQLVEKILTDKIKNETV